MLERTLNDSVGQLVRKHQKKQTRFLCIIRRVGYVSRHVVVTGGGYAGPHKVPVVTNIKLGTADRPKVFAGDRIYVEKIDGKWWAVELRNKNRCPVNTSAADEDVEINIDSSNSYDVQGDFGAGLTPLDLMIPPLELLGDITPPDLRLPETLCGIPLCCTDPPENGQVLMYDSGLGCLKWGFRGGCVGGGLTFIGTAAGVDGQTLAIFLGSPLYYYPAPTGLCNDGTYTYLATTLVAEPDPFNVIDVGGGYISVFDDTPTKMSDFALNAPAPPLVGNGGSPSTLVVSNSYLYVLYIGSYLESFHHYIKNIDKSNPSSLSVVSSTVLSGSLASESLNAVATISGSDYLFFGSGGLVYVTAASAPNTIIATLDGPGGNGAGWLGVDGSTVLTSISYFDIDDNLVSTFSLYNLSTPSSPVLSSTVEFINDVDGIGDSLETAGIIGDRVYAMVAHTTDGITFTYTFNTYDISDLTAPVLLTSIDYPDEVDTFTYLTAKSLYLDTEVVHGYCLGADPMNVVGSSNDESGSPYYERLLLVEGHNTNVVIGGTDTDGSDNPNFHGYLNSRIFLYQGQ